MARAAGAALPTVRGGELTLPPARNGKDEAEAHPIAVGSPTWWVWLARDTSTQFCFEAGLLRFTARRRRHNGAWYWYASVQQSEDRHHDVMLGATAELTLERLEWAAETLEHTGGAVSTSSTNTNLASHARHAARKRPSVLPSVPPAERSGPGADPRVKSGANSPTPSSQPVPLLATKLFIPQPRPTLVPRPRLLFQLDMGARGPLTVLAAPAGWGKTTAVASWCASLDRDRPVAWVSLDTGDNDPVRFWTYVLTALNAAYSGIADDALTLLHLSQPPAIEAALTLLLNALVALPADAILVLDDYHLITAAAVHTSLSYLLEHLPPQFHLVVASREDPPLPVARFRASGRLCELRADDLRFTAEEAAAFLTETAGLPLEMEAVEALEARTEGWIAGLQLAALSMQGRSDERAGEFIAAFGGSNRYIVDYLVEEVLARQPPEVQTFLLRTAVLDRFCAPLCDVLLVNGSEATSSAALGGLGETVPHPVPHSASGSRPHRLSTEVLLKRMERANLFLIPLDDERRWYRFHHLFAEALRSRLRDEDPDLYAELHRRASVWCEAEGLFEEAVGHALAAADFERAATLIERHTSMIALREGRFETALGWIKALPEPLVRARPLLCAQHALLLLYSFHFEAAEARLHEAEADVTLDVLAPREGDAVAAAAVSDNLSEGTRTILGYIHVVRANLAVVAGDVADALAVARRAVELVPASDIPWYLAAQVIAAIDYVVSGDVTAAAERRVVAALASAREADLPVLVLTFTVILGDIHTAQGRLRHAIATFREVERIAGGRLSLAQLVEGHYYYAGLGELLWEQNELDDAEQLLHQAVDEMDGRLDLNAMVLMRGYKALARIHEARGQHARARATLDGLAEMARRRGFAPELVEQGAAARAQLQLAHGEMDTAARWADVSGLSSDDVELPVRREPAYLALARVRIAQGRSDPRGPFLHEAQRLLARLLANAEAKGRGWSVLEILVLQALAQLARRDRSGALGILARALTLAQPEGYVRLFADEGAPMAALLTAFVDAAGQRRLAVSQSVLDYAQFLLDVCRAQDCGVSAPSRSMVPMSEGIATGLHHLSHDVPPLLDPLTEREVEVLRLLAEGASNATIAARLVVTVGTVKKHAFNVCSKLGASNRTQAVARARALRLL